MMARVKPSRSRAGTRAAIRALVVFIGCCLWPTNAHAYAWMIRHDYAQCAQCHFDPSGGGALTAYGRSLGEVVLRTHYDEADGVLESDQEASNVGNFLFGAVELPEALELGGDLRVLSLHSKVEKVEISHELIWMQADAHAALRTESFVASGTLGYSPRGGLGAALTRRPNDNWVSREHWAGFWLEESPGVLLRAGRMNVPFGIRSIEHTLWARAYTRSDSNDAQQYGVAFSYLSGSFRGELMAVLGNLELRPDVFRERGYSGYGEWFVTPNASIGVSSRISHVALDAQLLKEEWRHAHGLFSRWASGWQPLVLLSELDYVFESPKYQLRRQGFVGYAQADLEAIQGVHFMGTLETSSVGTNHPPPSWGGWLSYAWFFAPHADLRLDSICQSFASNSGRTSALSFLIQAHLYL